MSALLLKDFYTLLRQTRLFLLIIVIFAVMPGSFMAGFAVIYAAMLPITALAYDERSKWDSLAAMMPYTPTEIVISKYVLGYIGIGLAGLLALAAQSIVSMVQYNTLESADTASILLIACVATVFLAITLPFMFKVGVEKGRILLFVILAAIAAAAMILGTKLDDYFNSVKLQMNTIALAAVTGSAVLNLCSIALAVRFYKRKSK
mgnify:CR=1 FL=1